MISIAIVLSIAILLLDLIVEEILGIAQHYTHGALFSYLSIFGLNIYGDEIS